MRPIKFKYTFKRKKDGHIYQLIVPIECLEDGHGEIFSMLKNQEWELIGKDQFTEFHDINNVEIYEGDILKLTTYTKRNSSVFYESIGKVFFIDGAYRTNMAYVFDGNEPLSYWLNNNAKVEIIGNIYEKPDMLIE